MLVIAGAGIAGLSLLYHLAEAKYPRRITLIDKAGIGKRKVSMFAFREKLIELLNKPPEELIRKDARKRFLSYYSPASFAGRLECVLNGGTPTHTGPE